jgi:hydroxypyruvate isomerase
MVRLSAYLTQMSGERPRAQSWVTDLVLEPVNATVDHPGQVTNTAAEGAAIVRAVDHPKARLLFDVSHEQITNGDLVLSIRAHEDAIGHVHVADNPGRNQPETGELNYATVFNAIDDSAYDGFVGCEFVPTAGSDVARVLDAVAELA